jgi:hypothetical protein
MSRVLLRSWFITLWLMLLLYILLSNTNSQPYSTLQATDIIAHMQNDPAAEIDVIILTPTVKSEDEKTDYTILSVLRFAKWVKRIHLACKEKHSNVYEAWTTQSNLILFHHDLLQYTLTAPNLSEKFIIISPQHLFSNYVFKWQFFAGDSPCVKLQPAGCTPLTRTIFNECVYTKVDPKYQIAYAVSKGLRTGTIAYANNRDHLTISHNPMTISSIKKISTQRSEDTIFKYFKYTDRQLGFDNPVKVVVCVIGNNTDDQYVKLPTNTDSTVKIWVKLSTISHDSARLSFLHRMLAGRHMFVEISPDGSTDEQYSVRIIRSLRSLLKSPFVVTRVFSYGMKENLSNKILSNEIANKLAIYFQSLFEILPPQDIQLLQDDTNYLAEQQRRSFL